MKSGSLCFKRMYYWDSPALKKALRFAWCGVFLFKKAYALNSGKKESPSGSRAEEGFVFVALNAPNDGAPPSFLLAQCHTLAPLLGS